VADDRNGGSAGTNDLADGIQVREPVRRAAVDAALDATGGDAIAVSTSAVETALSDLRDAGFGVEPTAAVAPAGLRAYRDRGVVDADADVVVPLTGRAK
jgi:threonine synthase